MDADTLRRTIAYGAVIAFTPVLLYGAARLFPARRGGSPQISDARRFARISIVAAIAMIVSVWSSIFIGIALRFPNSSWFVAYIFGWLLIPDVVVVAVATLPRGTDA